MNLPFINRLSIPKLRVSGLALLTLIALLVFLRWSPLAYGANLTKAGAVVSQSASALNAPQAVNALIPQLFYPAVYKGFNENSQNANSTLTVQNLSQTTNALVQVKFYGENGQPIIPTNLGSVTNNFSLNPKASVTIPLEAVSEVPTNGPYSVVVSSDQPLAGVNWVRLSNGSGTTTNDASLGFAPQTTTTVYVPSVARAASGFNSHLSIQNLSNVALNNVLLTFWDQGGSQVGQINSSIPPYSAWHPQLFTLPNGFSGSMTVSAPGPVAVIDNKLGPNGNILLTTSGATSGATTGPPQILYAPFLFPQSGYSAALTIQNTSSNQTATVIIENSDGLGNTQLNIAPHASQTINYPTNSHSAQFAAKITATQPVVAVATLQNTNGVGYTFSAFEQAGLSSFVLPLLVKQYQNAGSTENFFSGAMLLNAGSAAAQVVVNYSNGSTSQTVVNPGQFVNIATFNAGNLPIGFAGSAVVTSSQPLFALSSILRSGNGDAISVYRGVALPPPAVTLVKTANVQAIKPGDPLTYTLSFAEGANGGTAVITDIIPSQLHSYTYSVSAGVVVTPTGNTDYQWNVVVPAAGGKILVRGIVDPTIVTDTQMINTAIISGNSAIISSTARVIVDLTAPETNFSNTPPNPDFNTTPTFSFSGSDGGGIAIIECQLDGGAWENCPFTSYTTPVLSNGSHTFSVRAIDRVGRVDPTPATYTWIVDTTLASTPTATPLSDTPTPTPTNTDIPGNPTATPTNTDIPGNPTATPTNTGIPGNPTATPTNTGIPGNPTATSISGQPTATPTQTAIPGTPTATPTLPASDATTVAQPGQPATLTYSDPNGGGVAVQIPAGAIDQAATFLYDDQGAPSHTGSFQFAGRTFTLTAYRDNSAVNGFIFQQPVTLVIDYTDSDVTGLDENTLTLFYYDVAHGVWLEQGITVVARDPANNRITLQINHLTEFALGTTNRNYLPLIKR